MQQQQQQQQQHQQQPKMRRITQIYFLFVFFSLHVFWTQLKGSTVGAFNLTSVSYDGKLNREGEMMITCSQD